jgi:predicted DCC family thiol-disulfide oxidoreductase YuxK
MNVIFFDGYCGLCNGFIDFVMKHDMQNKFLFSPLQGEFAKSHLSPEEIQDLKSVIVMINENKFRKSKAVFAIFKELGGMWSFFLVLNILPLRILDFGYEIVASNRYRWFGKRSTCRLPSAEEKLKFLS